MDCVAGCDRKGPEFSTSRVHGQALARERCKGLVLAAFTEMTPS
jgi:hypothetical protein